MLAALAVVLVGKPLAALVVVRAARAIRLRSRLPVAVALAQIGEFSFILAALGRQLGVLPAVAANTRRRPCRSCRSSLNPLLFRLGRSPSNAGLGTTPLLWRLLDPRTPVPHDGARHRTDASHRAVVVGYGPTGRLLTRLLRDNGIEPAVIEMNLDTVRALREEGVAAVYGDAAQRDTLQAAGVAAAASLVLTTDLPSAAEVIRVARELRPGIRILARTGSLRDRRRRCAPPAPTPCLPARARWRWRSPKPCCGAWARPPSRSTASVPASTPSSSKTRAR